MGEADPDEIKEALEEEEKLLRETKTSVVVVREKEDESDEKQRTRPRATEFINTIRPRKKRNSKIHSGENGIQQQRAEHHDRRHDETVPGMSPVATAANGAPSDRSIAGASSTPKQGESSQPISATEKPQSPERLATKSGTSQNRSGYSAAGSGSAGFLSPSREVAMAKKRAAVQQVPRNPHRDLIERRPSSVPKEDMEIFEDSTLTLPGSKVRVAREIAEKLKPHQVEAVEFMWRNVFGDVMQEGNDFGGCILAHNMGLGKTLSSIALIHSVFLHDLAAKILLIVPINTVENWKNEFKKWVGHLRPYVDPDSLGDATTRSARTKQIQKWFERGGVLITAKSQLSIAPELTEKCDLLVIDEAHACLKNTATKTFAALKQIKTKRKIALTGTPLQNNLLEYHAMVDYLRPGVLLPYAEFEREYVIPIVQGLTSDCSKEQEKQSAARTAVLTKLLEPFMHRKSSSELAKDLPPMQQVVLYTRQSKLQQRLYRSHKLQQNRRDCRNFFAAFSALKPIHNHPGCLLMRNQQQKAKTKDDDEESAVKWWDTILEKFDGNELTNVDHGFKIVLLLHILVKAGELGEKVVVFSQCIKTLNFVENVLQHNNWLEHSESLAGFLKDNQIGGWKKGREYLRIDGGTSSLDRGDQVTEFDQNDRTRVFLLSSVAGGVGINLVAANRVILLDTHFNPAISEQAIFRLFRYGQKKHTYVYRLLTQGSMEEKVYARAVTKTGLAMRIVDQKNMDKFFTSDQIADLQKNFTWAQCDKCSKWRVLHEFENEELPDKWYCYMNKDEKNKTCDDPERNDVWYETEARLRNQPEGAVDTTRADDSGPSMSPEEKSKLEENDPILQHLLKITETGKETTMIYKHEFHDVITQPKEDDVPLDEIASTSVNSKEDGKVSAKSPIKKSRTHQKSGGSNGKRKSNDSTPPSKAVESHRSSSQRKRNSPVQGSSRTQSATSKQKRAQAPTPKRLDNVNPNPNTSKLLPGESNGRRAARSGDSSAADSVSTDRSSRRSLRASRKPDRYFDVSSEAKKSSGQEGQLADKSDSSSSSQKRSGQTNPAEEPQSKRSRGMFGLNRRGGRDDAISVASSSTKSSSTTAPKRIRKGAQLLNNLFKKKKDKSEGVIDLLSSDGED
eukprot:CAMPEP_0172450822 /NCGR_PEP_ID=MMETSP1065-20121228/9040_1 /TAXON_ID=265537 /ORGANISM="Amphiprora paludosa, Strain CCMP125" /LENGTH=1131 /DNA_ID=CAMNT_0013202661 /DNA_START=38 /DNA_END=3433 /DNA_ORIENTATION=-